MLTFSEQRQLEELRRKNRQGGLSPEESQLFSDLMTKAGASVTDLSPGISPSSSSAPVSNPLNPPAPGIQMGAVQQPMTAPRGLSDLVPTSNPLSTHPMAETLTDKNGKINWWIALAPLVSTALGYAVGGRKGAMFGAKAGTGLLEGVVKGEEIGLEREREAKTLEMKGQERAQAKKRFGMEEIEFTRREKEAVLAEVERTGQDPVDPKGNTTNEIASAKLKYQQTQEKLGQEKEARELALREEKEQQAVEGGDIDTLTALYGGGPLAQARAKEKILDFKLDRDAKRAAIRLHDEQAKNLANDNALNIIKDRTLPREFRAKAYAALGTPLTPEEIGEQDDKVFMDENTAKIIKERTRLRGVGQPTGPLETDMDDLKKLAAIRSGKPPPVVEITDLRKEAITKSITADTTDEAIERLPTPAERAFAMKLRAELRAQPVKPVSYEGLTPIQAIPVAMGKFGGRIKKGLESPGAIATNPLAAGYATLKWLTTPMGKAKPDTTTTQQQKPQPPFAIVTTPPVSTAMPTPKRPYSAAEIDLLRRARTGDESAIQEARKKGLL